jgi:adenylate cyclase
VVRGGTRSVEAWELYLQADVQVRLWSKESEAKARELLQQALTIDPDYVDAWNQLASTHLVDARFGYSDSRKDSLRAAEEAAARALSVDDTNSRAYGILGAIHLWKGEHDKSIAMREKALTLNPNGSGSFAGLAWTMFCSGRPEEALELIQQAMRLNPNYPAWWLMILEEAYRLSGRYEEAIESIKEELRRYENYFTRTRLALYYAQTGRDEEARAEIARALRIKPDMNLKIWANAQFFKDTSQLERDLADLRRVGLPE